MGNIWGVANDVVHEMCGVLISDVVEYPVQKDHAQSSASLMANTTATQRFSRLCLERLGTKRFGDASEWEASSPIGDKQYFPYP